MEWVRGKPIGRGSFSTVSLAIPRNGDAERPLMAVKSSENGNSDMLRNEKQVLEQLEDCAEIIRCFGDDYSFENGAESYNVLLEYAAGGSLVEHVRNAGGRLPESDVRRVTKSILRGLRYIHEKEFVHCDIKLQNILVFPDGAKIADFGLAKKAGERKTEVRGTPLYMSPESVTGGEYESPVDIWALGCAVVEMVTGKPAWYEELIGGNVMGLMARIGAGKEIPRIPAELSEDGKDFLGKCFVKDPRKRWTAEMLLSHSFVVADDEDDEFLKKDGKSSPRDVFEFPDWNSISSSIGEESCDLDRESLTGRLNSIVSENEASWSVSSDWITVR